MIKIYYILQIFKMNKNKQLLCFLYKIILILKFQKNGIIAYHCKIIMEEIQECIMHSKEKSFQLINGYQRMKLKMKMIKRNIYNNIPFKKIIMETLLQCYWLNK